MSLFGNTIELSEIRKEVHQIHDEKQDKIKTGWVFSIAAWVIASSFSSVWWAASVNTTMDNMTLTLKTAAENRFTAHDAAAAFKLQEATTIVISRRLDIHDTKLDKMQETIHANEKQINQMQAGK